MRKVPWTTAEDAILINYVKKHGDGRWDAVQKNSDVQRNGKSCRLRWLNYLRPTLKKGLFSPEEEMLIKLLHAKFGNRWALIASYLPGRTDNGIKNYFNTKINKEKAGLRLPPYRPGTNQHMSLRSSWQRQTTPWIATSPPALKPLQTPLSWFKFNSAMPQPSQIPYESFLQDSNRGNMFSFQSPPSYSARVELPSSQSFSSNSCSEQMLQVNSGLWDALLQDSKGVGELDYSDSYFDTFNISTPPGIQVKQELVETVETVNPDVSTLLDMIPMQMTSPILMTAPSDWYNNSSSGGEYSNGPSSVVTSDDEIELEMQQLPSMTPVELDWDLCSYSCDNMQ